MSAAKNVKLTVSNYSDAEVKVTKVEYLDGSDWKTENMLGVDGHKKIEPHGQHYTFPRRDLEDVEGQTTEFRVTYRDHVGGVTWGDKRYAHSPSFAGVDEASVTVSIR
jgi:hypothetical protein